MIPRMFRAVLCFTYSLPVVTRLSARLTVGGPEGRRDNRLLLHRNRDGVVGEVVDHRRVRQNPGAANHLYLGVSLA